MGAEEQLLTETNFLDFFDNEAKSSEMEYLFFALRYVASDGAENANFIARKEVKKHKKTKILYIKDGVRVRFTDEDILEMLLEINDKKVLEQILSAILECYKGAKGSSILYIDNKPFNITKLPLVDHKQTLHNTKDIDVEFEDFYTLLNLILAKDIAAKDSEMFREKEGNDFILKTVSKYYLIIKYYGFNCSKCREIFESLNLDLSGDFRKDFILGKHAKGNLSIISKKASYEFEKICANI